MVTITAVKSFIVLALGEFWGKLFQAQGHFERRRRNEI
jgi:hypothetical protein